MANVQSPLVSPDRVIELAGAGRIAKGELAELRNAHARAAFVNACAAIERSYTEACTAQHDPCLEGGCALEGEICLAPLERSHPEYERACGAAFVELYLNPSNRA
jgi:hypothetical protein